MCFKRVGGQQSTWVMALLHAINGHFSSCIVVVAVVAFLWLWLVVELCRHFPRLRRHFARLRHGYCYWLLWL